MSNIKRDSSVTGKIPFTKRDSSVTGKMSNTKRDSGATGKMSNTTLDSSITEKMSNTKRNSGATGKMSNTTLDSSSTEKMSNTKRNSSVTGKLSNSKRDAGDVSSDSEDDIDSDALSVNPDDPPTLILGHMTPEEAKEMVSRLPNKQIYELLIELRQNVGPVVETTRPVYKQLLESILCGEKLVDSVEEATTSDKSKDINSSDSDDCSNFQALWQVVRKSDADFQSSLNGSQNQNIHTVDTPRPIYKHQYEPILRGKKLDGDVDVGAINDTYQDRNFSDSDDSFNYQTLKRKVKKLDADFPSSLNGSQRKMNSQQQRSNLTTWLILAIFVIVASIGISYYYVNSETEIEVDEGLEQFLQDLEQSEVK